uniref:Sidoreflexin n=1 Tax=Steinernema glaseri TaxID=37863 RepID=A0A1I7Y406_9BILA
MSSELVLSLVTRPDVSKPRWSQESFEGRLRHFYSTVNPLNILVSSEGLETSRKVISDYKKGIVGPSLTVDQLWRHKQIYDSAFHPETGEKMFILGRMSAQVPCNMIITGGLLTFYKNPRGVFFWHWLNQSFNANVNYANRSGENPITLKELGCAYVGATTGALAVAFGLNQVVGKFPPLELGCAYVGATTGALAVAFGLNQVVGKFPPLVGRLVPFAAVACANAINIPLMRYKEFTDGITLEDETGRVVGKSTSIAKFAVTEVVVSRVGMALPYMVLTPVIMNQIVKTMWYQRRPWTAGPIQTVLAGLGLLVSTPFCCALFPQKKSIEVAKLDEAARAQVEAVPNPPKVVYYNKGL